MSQRREDNVLIACSLGLASAFAAEPPPPAVVVPPTTAEIRTPETSFRVSVVPGVGLDADPDLAVDGLAVGFVSKAVSLQGMDAELGLSWVDGSVEGVQGALGVAVAGEVDGLQVAGGASWARGDVELAQLAGFVAIAEGEVRGLQGSSSLNVARAVDGVQLSGGINVAEEVEGLQGALLNVGGDVRGAQLGLVNVGRDVDGLQLGLVNVAKTSGVSVAPLNFIGDGLHRVDVWTSESAVASGAVKFGSRNVYTLIGAGWVNPTQPWWTFGAGFGLHLPVGPVWLELDDSVWALSQGFLLAPGAYDKLRLQVGLDLVHGHLAPFAGVSVNTWVGDGTVAPRAFGIPESRDEGHHVVAWPGFHVGMSF